MGRYVLLGGISSHNMMVTVIHRCVKMLSGGKADATDKESINTTRLLYILALIAFTDTQTPGPLLEE